MKLKINKKDVEKLFYERDFKTIEDLLKLAYPVSVSKGIIDFFINSEGTRSVEYLKEYVVGSVMKGIRSYNESEDVKYFEPYIEKRTFFKKKMSTTLTPEEETYIKVFPHDEKEFKKDLKGKVSKEAYTALKRIYEEDKENTYTLIHRTAAEVDPIFVNGIKFGSSTFLYEMCQRVDNFQFMLGAISLCGNYKSSLGCFIIKIPKTAITEKNVPIYYKKDDSVYLNPKYVVAYAPVVAKKILPIEINTEANNVESQYCFDENVPGVVSNLYHKM